jgi:putative addiction module killer protein
MRVLILESFMPGECSPKEIKIYEKEDGSQPFSIWLNGISDQRARARIRTRLDRLRLGNLGDHKSVGKGVVELREHYGPGYRIYVGQEGDKVVILLCGGEKDSQETDILTAQDYWADYGRRDDA